MIKLNTFSDQHWFRRRQLERLLRNGWIKQQLAIGAYLWLWGWPGSCESATSWSRRDTGTCPRPRIWRSSASTAASCWGPARLARPTCPRPSTSLPGKSLALSRRTCRCRYFKGEKNGKEKRRVNVLQTFVDNAVDLWSFSSIQSRMRLTCKLALRYPPCTKGSAAQGHPVGARTGRKAGWPCTRVWRPRCCGRLKRITIWEKPWK